MGLKSVINLKKMRCVLGALMCMGLSALLTSPSPVFAQKLAQKDTKLTSRWVTLTEESLMPIPLGAREREARAALKAGEWLKAAQLITPPYADPSVQYLKASLYSRARSWRDVLTHLQGLERDKRLKDAVWTLRAEASLELEEYAGCETAAAQVSRDDPELRYESLRYRAKALRELKRWREAREASEELLKSEDEGDRAVARLGLALTALAEGHHEEATRAFKLIDINHPSSWSARRARQEVKPLLSDPHLKVIWSARSPAEEALRAQALMSRRQHDEVINATTSLLKKPLPDDLRCELMVLKGRAYDKQRKRRDALSTLNDALKLCTQLRHSDTPVALYVGGRAADIIDDDKTQERLFWSLFKDYQHQLSDDAAVFLIQLYNATGIDFKPPKNKARSKKRVRKDKKKASKRKGKERGKRKSKRKGKNTKKRSPKRAQKAVRRFNPRWLDQIMKVARLVPQLHPEGDMSAEALNFAFVAAMRAKHYTYAQEVLDLAHGLTPSDFSYYHSGLFQYWRGRLAAHKRRHKEARAHYISAINSAPLSWYALLAYSRLYERDAQLANEVARRSVERTHQGLGLPGGEGRTWSWRFSIHDPRWPSLERALMWLRLGLERRGRQELTELSKDGARPDLQWLSAWILDTYELYHWSHDIPRRQLIEYRHFPLTGGTRKHWELAFPAPFGAEVHSAAEAEELDPSFIWGVMREESGYARGVRSHASAVGLLQLLVPTANMMVRRGEQKVSAEDLARPEVNVMLGARYLRWVKRSAGVPLQLVPAGYNAGHGALKRWLRERGDLPLDLFVETIPYQEARWYLKRVNASWITFKTLYRREGGASGSFWPLVGQKTRLKD
jgi:tetratricopeptide (TPR) repeat protein